MKGIRALMATLIVITCLSVVRWVVVLPIRINQMIGQAESATAGAWTASDQFGAAAQAKRILAIIQPALERNRTNVSLLMVSAANKQLVGRFRSALMDYDTALQVDRRPELYLQRGLTLLGAGRRMEAIPDLITANLFSPTYFADIPDGETSRDVQAIILDRERRIQARLLRPTYSISSSQGNLVLTGVFREMTDGAPKTLAQGVGNLGDSAAEGWKVWNTSDGATATEILPSTHTPGRKMLHVTTTAKQSGIWNFWLPGGSGPARAITSASIYVLKGQVTVGSGDAGRTSPDAATSRTGVWELVQGQSQSCPVNATTVTPMTNLALTSTTEK